MFVAHFANMYNSLRCYMLIVVLYLFVNNNNKDCNDILAIIYNITLVIKFLLLLIYALHLHHGSKKLYKFMNFFF